jgi:catechol 2,3-dioxygenase-like lactoylglutathione lyase family enzyme
MEEVLPMKLNHVNLFSVDVPADVAMFETYFGLRCTVRRGDRLAVLHDEQGLTLVLNDFAEKRGDFDYPEDSDVLHIGFLQESRDRVDALHARLKAGGWAVPEPSDYHGAWTFYFAAKGGYFIEVATETQHGRADQATA